MVFVIIGAVILGAVVLVGGGNTIQGLGQDIKNTSEHIQK